MEVLLGYLLGLGTVAVLVRRGDQARNAVAWTARQVGAMSGKVGSAIDQAARLAREEYEKGRVAEGKNPLAEGLGSPDQANGAPAAQVSPH